MSAVTPDEARRLLSERIRLSGFGTPDPNRYTPFLDVDQVRAVLAEVERLAADNQRLREALQRIASEDYRGNRPYAVAIAAAALSPMSSEQVTG